MVNLNFFMEFLFLKMSNPGNVPGAPRSNEQSFVKVLCLKKVETKIKKKDNLNYSVYKNYK